jgi:hypothetical protein
MTQVNNTVQGLSKLESFLQAALPPSIPRKEDPAKTLSRDELIQDVRNGVEAASMAVRVT